MVALLYLLGLVLTGGDDWEHEARFRKPEMSLATTK
jgi:hypothetical protein